jgi:copper(I)-binding protein
MRRFLLALLGLVLAAGAAVTMAAESWRLGDIEIEGAWARPTAGRPQNGAAYLTITNHGAEPDRLLGAEGEIARLIDLHQHRIDPDGVARMRPVEGIELPPGETVRLEPGGLHVMLMGLAKPLRAGASFPLHLVFERAGEVEVEVAVEQPARGGHGHGG